MNPFDSDNPLAPLYAFICICLAFWGIADSSCANSEKQICQAWQNSNLAIANAVEKHFEAEK